MAVRLGSGRGDVGFEGVPALALGGRVVGVAPGGRFPWLDDVHPHVARAAAKSSAARTCVFITVDTIAAC
jgi:hypothetical protein